jgi:hypothetical protein
MDGSCGKLRFTHLETATLTRATLSTVKSCAMMARHPSVPNLILFIVENGAMVGENSPFYDGDPMGLPLYR